MQKTIKTTMTIYQIESKNKFKEQPCFSRTMRFMVYKKSRFTKEITTIEIKPLIQLLNCNCVEILKSMNAFI